MKLFLSTIALVLLTFTSCKKDNSFTKDHLDFSKDTVLFDTVFTTVGSTTKRLKIYNNNNQPIMIDAVELMGGASSPFRINLDGISADFHSEVEIPANDSLFAFVEVTLVVNNATNPLIISDSIRFETNGLSQYVNLDVWGQDAYFHNSEVVSGNWANDKPHVLYNTVAVGFPGIDSNLNLTIPAGTEVFCHKNSQLIVYKSSIDIQGSYGNEVVFQGDRLESFYDDVSGQWWGIRLIEANTSNIDYAIIRNGSVGLQVDSTASAVTLNLTNTIIDNNDFFGFNANAGPIINASNCFFGDAGISSAYLFAGGDYTITHCDFINYWSGSRAGPALAVANYFEVENITYCRPLTALFENNIVDGTIDKEFVMDTLDCSVNMTFGVNYFKRDEIYDYTNYSNVLWSGDAGYVDVTMKDFHLLETSILRNIGLSTFIVTDLEGNARVSPDLGCYEFN